MNHLPRIGLLISFTFALGGCPVWTGDDGSSCYGGSCYSGSGGSGGYGQQCYDDTDCNSDQYCGTDSYCHSFNPSTTTSSATSVGGSSVGGSGSTTGSTTTSSTGGTGGAPAVIYCGNPADCGDGQTCAPNGTCEPGDCKTVGCIFGYTCDTNVTGKCQPTNPAACALDADCSADGAGFECVDGTCTAPADQCSDQTQCADGDVCANGKCTPSCANGASCPSDYTCSALNTCSTPAKGCTITNDCGGPSSVCVAGACVPRSGANGNCSAGTAWVENGCIPDQKASFFCANNGVQDICAKGSICLHHNCYISCDAPNQNACSGQPTFTECKPVESGKTQFNVCGNDSNLGSECDPTDINKSCSSGKVCIDGFCK